MFMRDYDNAVTVNKQRPCGYPWVSILYKHSAIPLQLTQSWRLCSLWFKIKLTECVKKSVIVWYHRLISFKLWGAKQARAVGLMCLYHSDGLEYWNLIGQKVSSYFSIRAALTMIPAAMQTLNLVSYTFPNNTYNHKHVSKTCHLLINKGKRWDDN